MLLEEDKTKLFSTYSDLKAVFIKRSISSLLHIINKAMFINGDGNCVNLLNDDIATNKNGIHSTINRTPVDAFKNSDKVKSIITSSKSSYTQPKHKVGDYVRNVDKRNIFSKDTHLIGIENFLKLTKFQKQPPTYKIEETDGEITEGIYFKQKFSKCDFDFESKKKVPESLNMDLRS